MPKEVFKCAWCGKELLRYRYNPHGKLIDNHFCNTQCKGEWDRARRKKEREDQGYTKEWLYEQYIVKGRDCNDIAREIGKDGKTVWKWVTDYGIETRKRGYASQETSPFKKGQPSVFKGHHHTEETREHFRQLRLADGHVPYLVNGKHWLKQEGKHPASWKGGITPERQAFYATEQWRKVEKYVRERDNNTCQLCGMKQPEDCKRQFHIHHIYKFDKNERLRAHPDNLVVLCHKCHMFVHSSKNTEHKFMTVPMVLPDWLKGEQNERVSKRSSD